MCFHFCFCGFYNGTLIESWRRGLLGGGARVFLSNFMKPKFSQDFNNIYTSVSVNFYYWLLFPFLLPLWYFFCITSVERDQNEHNNCESQGITIKLETYLHTSKQMNRSRTFLSMIWIMIKINLKSLVERPHNIVQVGSNSKLMNEDQTIIFTVIDMRL